MKTTNHTDVRYVLNEEKDLKEARSKIVLLLIDCSIVCTILYLFLWTFQMIRKEVGL